MIFIEDQDQLLKKHQVIDLQEQSSQDKEPRWSEESQARMLINVRLISSCLESLQESLNLLHLSL